MDTLPPAPLPLSLSLSLSLSVSPSRRGMRPGHVPRSPVLHSPRGTGHPLHARRVTARCRRVALPSTLALSLSLFRFGGDRKSTDRERERERERETSAGRSENRFAPRARNRIDRAATVDSPAHPPYRNACRDKVRYIASPCLAPMLGSIPKEGADSSVVTARTRGHADGRAILNGNRAYDTVALSAAPPSFATSLAATSRSAATATTDTGPPHRSLNSV